MKTRSKSALNVCKASGKHLLLFILLLCLTFGLPMGLMACTSVKSTPPDELDTFRPGTAGAYTYFAAQKSNTALRIRWPNDWKLLENEGGYEISDGEVSVGTVTLGAIAENADGMNEVESTTYKETNLTVHTGIYKRDGQKVAVYRVTYTYTDDAKADRTISLEIDDAQMDATAYKWLLKPEVMPIKDHHTPPHISLSEGNGKASVLILGNSFVYDGYSGIGPTLRDLMAAGNRACSVTVKGNGYASVSAYATETGSNYKSYIDNIKAGQYGVVLMCGLYSDADVTALDTILAACRTGNAQLVLFPAHNESAARIEAAKAAYPQLPVLNWKGQIDALIDAGLAKEDFCVDDQHSHSNALAGYVGAALVYEALFDEAAPTLPTNAAVIAQAAVNAKLNTVSVSPTVLIPDKDIHYLFKN
ncbi:MAG: hypothetical protein E7650_03195 [Ruminococcaceae bacterium]|nr:hypothetical protein [Oscillospiraceae bacterium]